VCADLLNKTFRSGYNVEVKARSDSNVAVSGAAQFNDKGQAKLSMKGSYIDPVGNFAVDKLEITSDKVTSAEFSLKNSLPNTKLAFK
jgi:hypothetical protein